ncbi:MAG: phosphoribosylglycinamide formyltransferase [Nitrospirae bacterium]|nr:phosphoribosylglycinamide formyltransferase [Nitrospirota bacterium]
MPAERMRIGVLCSGRGSNLQAILDAARDPAYPARVAVVISDNPHAYAIQRAREHAVPAEVIIPASFPDRIQHDLAVAQRLEEHGVGLVALAGYMRIVSPQFIRCFPGRVMNIHPALLPSFPGLHAQKQAVLYGVKVSGVTVHFVDEGVDTGPIILQIPVAVADEDTEESLSARILEHEHRAYPEAIRLFAEGRLRVEGRKVRILAGDA